MRSEEEDGALESAHPRWRGAHFCFLWLSGFCFGSSPLARGTSGAWTMYKKNFGLIPAGAGHISAVAVLLGRWWAHPRWRGAHGKSRTMGHAQGGSSPLARGTWRLLARQGCSVGLIPAGAGHILRCTRPCRQRAAHPRWRGAHARATRGALSHTGSSPLARGTFHLGHEFFFRHRLIPAGAGHMECLRYPCCYGAAHPRWRGAHANS